jgi:glycosyltransferase involved in cell wall biosynthesis
VAGAVPAIEPHIAEAHVLAVPLDSGGGTRLKILEAFASGLPVVSTTIGCEGLTVRNGEHLVIVERESFVAGIQTILEDGGSAKRLAARARRLVREQYDWRLIGESLRESIRDLVPATH